MINRLLTTGIVSIGLLAGSVLFPADQAAAAECKDIAMSQVTQTVDPSDPDNLAPCNSPIDFCTEGTIQGWKNGTVHYDILSLNSVSGTVVSYTATATWFLKKGTVDIQEVGVFDPLPGGTGRFGSVQEIIGGTGDYVGATGELSLKGDTSDADPNMFFPQDLGGTICTPNGGVL